MQANHWAEAESKLAELKTVSPVDAEIRTWTADIEEHKWLEQERQAAEIERRRHKEDLQRKLGMELFNLPDLKPNLTLAEARERLALLRSKTNTIESRLKAEYPSLEKDFEVTKDTFEPHRITKHERPKRSPTVNNSKKPAVMIWRL